MIKILEKKMCTGCCACMNVCPMQCIEMESDHEGFKYPMVETKICINCRRCEKVCPLLNRDFVTVERFDHPKVMAAWNTDHAIRLDSTSGGIFSALADKMFNDGGLVAGAVFQKDHSVSHIVTGDSSLLDDIRSSKYLQSNMGRLFKDINELLESGRKVLICATPCQIAGLYSALGKDYDNLTTCDFICVGVNSPKVFLKYIQMLEQKYDSLVTKIKFKNKTFGWHRFSTRIDFDSGETYIKDRYHDPYMRSLLNAHLVRPSCYDCQFKGQPRQADITLADFWGIEKINPALDNDCGTSAVILNSQKGFDYFQNTGETIFAHECSLPDVIAGNRAFNKPIECKDDRQSFFAEIDDLPFLDLK